MTATNPSESQTVSSERKVVRGGSFSDDHRFICRACRYKRNPDDLYRFLGFRPVVNRVRGKKTTR